MSSEADIVQLIRDDMDRAEQTMHDILERAFYHSERPLFASFYTQPIPRWQQWIRHVRWYLANVWDAVCGRTCEDNE